MLYLISGASRAGKTIIAKKLSTQKDLSYFSLDWLIMGFTNGIPAYGIHDKLFPDEIAKRAWSFLKAMFENMLWSEIDYIIEGEALLPELVVDLLTEHPDEIRICFVGYTDVNVSKKMEEIKQFNSNNKDWLSDKSDEYIIDHVKNMVVHSLQMKKSCNENGIVYIDTSVNFADAIDNAITYLSE